MGENTTITFSSGWLTFILSVLIVAHYKYGDVYVLLTPEPWFDISFYIFSFGLSVILSTALAFIVIMSIIILGASSVGVYALFKKIVTTLKESGLVIKLFIKNTLRRN